MRKFISAIAALGAAASMVAITPAAEARPGYHYRGGHHYGHHYRGHYGRYHHGRGYWHNGRWIALGVGAAIAAGAAAAAYDHCYWRHGERYCD
jgi:hypothetical protein